MPVQVEGVAARVQVVNGQLDNLVLGQDEAVRVSAVDLGVGGQVAASQRCVECGNRWCGVCDVVEEGTDESAVMYYKYLEYDIGGGDLLVGAIVEIVHDDLEMDLMICLSIKGSVVIWNKLYVIIHGPI